MTNLTDTEADDIRAHYIEAGKPASYAEMIISQLADCTRERIDKVMAVVTPENARRLRAHDEAVAAEPVSGCVAPEDCEGDCRGDCHSYAA